MLRDKASYCWSIDTSCVALFNSDTAEQPGALQLLVAVTYMYVNSMQVGPMMHEGLNHVWSTVSDGVVQRGPILQEGHHTHSWLLLLGGSCQG